MYRYSCFKILIFSFLFPMVYGDVLFNSLSQKLVLSLINVTQIKNVVASEQLIRFPLCKLASVATGDAKSELLSFLGYKDDDELHKCYRQVRGHINALKQTDLTLTSRIYIDYVKGINPKFVQNSTENDGVRVETVGFKYPKAAVSYINSLISVMTFRRITDIVDSNDINNSTKMIIISGAHFKGTWETPFDYRLTKLMKFNHIDGKTSRVPMMNQMGEFWYNRGIHCEILSLRFRSYEASITFVLPKTKEELIGILQQIYNEKEFVKKLTKGLQEKVMKVSIPRFKIKTFIDWTGFLQGLGLYSVFKTNSSDLVGIFKTGQNQTISLTKVKQKVFVQIDEMGVDRKPIDAWDEKNAEMPTYNSYNLPEFVADRPFYFEIAWEINNRRYELFTGVYYGPEPDLATF